MGIRFDDNAWTAVRENYTKWWDRELQRPLIPVKLLGRDPGRPEPRAPILSQATCADLDIPAEALIDRLDYELSRYEYLGDAFPYVNFDCFGPGVAAAFLGAKLDNSSGKVWFHPKEIVPIDELHLEYDPDNIWLRRIKDIYRAGMERWRGQVLMGMPDLGGILDIISTFRPSENLLYDLYDDPDEVKRLVWEVHELWLRFYRELAEALGKDSPGYCDWAQIYSDKPSYVVQSDFSYMISPDFYDEFALPEMEEMCNTLDRTLYHLDGAGNLNHLDSVLSIRSLDAVQWVPGDGNPPQEEWPEVLERIRRAGKNMQLFGGFEALEKVKNILGTDCGIHLTAVEGRTENRERYIAQLKKYRVL